MGSTVESLLSGLLQLQSKGDSVYPAGIFRSQRFHPFLPYRREDDNLFFTSSIIKILQGVESQFDDSEKAVFDRIKSKALEAYPLFQNKDGLDTYNFWQTKPSRHFPNGWFMHRFKHFQIPDDVDDTALVFLTEGADKERVHKLREKLKLHANLAYKRAYNPLPKYRDLKCYSTFFGKRMYIEFDVCVLSNLMSVILPHYEEDELNKYDKDTLKFITEVILNEEHKKLPFYSAPNYPTTELILYHVSRLIPLLPKSYRNQIEEKLKQDIQDLLAKTNGLNRILMENAAMKLSIEFNPVEWNSEQLIDDRGFYFFHAGMITAFENSVAQKIANASLFHLRYTSKALNGALLIENLMLKRNLIP